MPAKVEIEQLTGGPPGSETYTVKTGTESGTRYYTMDSNLSGSSLNPIPIPTSDGGVSGSYWVTHCINVTQAPTTEITDLRYYQSWSIGPKKDWQLGSSNSWSAGLYIGVSSASLTAIRGSSNGFNSGSYCRASGTQGTSGYLISGNHAYYEAIATAMSGGWCPIDPFNSVTNAYMVQKGQVVAADTGRSWCIVTQVLVGSGAIQGEKTDKTATFVYSEI